MSQHTPERLLELIKKRSANLDPYLNSKELTALWFFYDKIESGLQSQETCSRFLEHVPEGEYDANRRKYEEIIYK